jgi:hypothetical protein
VKACFDKVLGSVDDAGAFTILPRERGFCYCLRPIVSHSIGREDYLLDGVAPVYNLIRQKFGREWNPSPYFSELRLIYATASSASRVASRSSKETAE